MSKKIELTELAAIDREVEFVLPNGTKTGFFLTLRYESAPEVQAVERKFRSKFLEANRRGRFSRDRSKLIDAMIDERRLAHVASWRWTKDGATYNGEQPAFSPNLLKEILSKDEQFAFFLKEFIDEEIGDAADFMASVDAA